MRNFLGYLLICIISSNILYGQTSIAVNYTFSQTQSLPYEQLVAPTIIDSGSHLNSQGYWVNLPFDYNFDNHLYNKVYVSVKGYITFGDSIPAPGSYWIINNTKTGFRSFSAFDAPLASLDGYSNISYKTLGIAPNRTFVIQWSRMGASGATTLSANFQVHLSESTGVIAAHYGGISLSGSSQVSVMIGIRGLNRSIFNNRSGTSWVNSVAGTSSSSNILYTSYNNPPNGIKYIFTPPTACNIPPNQPSNLSLVANSSSNSISFTAPSTNIPDKYLVVRTEGVPLNTNPTNVNHYLVNNVIGNGIVVYNGTSRNFNDNQTQPNTFYTYTIFPYYETCFGGPYYNTSNPLWGTIETRGARAYRWIPNAGSADFQLATNWQPHRTYKENNDTLIFDNGGSSTAFNLPANASTVKVIYVKNNTEIALTNSITSNVTVNDLFVIEQGSNVNFESNALIVWKFGTYSNFFIHGTLNLSGQVNIDVINANTEVTGVVKVNGANAEINSSCSTQVTCIRPFKFLANSKYFHERNGGKIPNAEFDATSTIYLRNITTVAPTTTNVLNRQDRVGNLYVECPNTNIVISTFNTANFSNVTLMHTGSKSYQLNDVNIYGNLILRNSRLEFNTSQKAIVYGDVVLDSSTLVITGVKNLSIHKNFSTTVADTVKGRIALVGSNTQVVDMHLSQEGFGIQECILNNPMGAILNGNMYFKNLGIVKIISGKWRGNGQIYYTGTSQLQYLGVSSLETTDIEWPTVNPPSKVTLNMSGNSPYNRLYLNSNKKTPDMTFTKGVVVLGAYDLEANLVYSSATFDNLISRNTFAAITGSGRFIHPLALGGGTASLIPVGTIDNGDVASPIQINLINDQLGNKIKVGVFNQRATSIPTTNFYLNRYFTFETSDTITTNWYKIKMGHADNDRIGTSNLIMMLHNDNTWIPLPTNAPNSNRFLYFDNYINSATAPIHGSILTAFIDTISQGANTYHWTGLIDNDFQNPLNWMPNRNNKSIADHLVFDHSDSVAVSNFLTEMIASLTIKNNTILTFTNSSGTTTGANQILSIKSDLNMATDELYLEHGSALYFHNSSTRFSFINSMSIVKINGNLVFSSAADATLDLHNTLTTVGASGVISAGNTSTTFINPLRSTAQQLEMYGTYIHNFTQNQGMIPLAEWKDGSNVIIRGGRTAAPINIQQNIYNLIFDFNITTAINYAGLMPDTIRGTFEVRSTGTTNWRWGSVSSASENVIYVNKYKQLNGTIDLSPTSSNNSNVMIIADSLLYMGGVLKGNTSNTSSTINFLGLTTQTAIFHNNAPTGAITYKITNSVGVNFIGTGSLASNGNFPINNYGGITIVTSYVSPITTNMQFVYNNQSTLKYEGKSKTATSIEYPATSSPYHLIVNLEHPSHSITLPFNRTVPGTLTLTNGDLDIGNYDLILGTGTTVATIGTLAQSGESSIKMNSGSFTRWYNNATAPTNITNIKGLFPIANGNNRRWAQILFSAANSITTGGTLTLRHTGINGTSTNVSLNDAGFIIDNKSNSYWKVEPGNGMVVNGTMSMAFRVGQAVLYSLDRANYRIMWPNSLIGNYGALSAGIFDAVRTGLSLSNISDSVFHVGTRAYNNNNVFVSVQSGDWKNPATWNRNEVPHDQAIVHISSFDTVSVDTFAEAKTISITNNGFLLMVNDSLLVDSMVLNSGNFEMRNGYMQVGLVSNEGGRSRFENAGSFNITSGKIKINGAFSAAGLSYNQHGGMIIVDGNLNGNAGLSVGSATPIVNISASQIIADSGIIHIIDPHVSNVSTAYTMSGGGFTGNHILILGDTLSNTNGGHVNGFNINSNTNSIAHLSILHSPTTTNRRTTFINGGVINGNLKLIKEGALLYTPTNQNLIFKGDIYIDTLAKIIIEGHAIFADDVNSALNNPQTISGKGTFGNVLTNPNASFNNITINNTSFSGVSFDIGDLSYSGNLKLINGKVNLGEYKLRELSLGVLTVTNGWINGIFQRFFSASSDLNYTFPVGIDQNATTILKLERGAISQSGYIGIRVLEGDHTNLNSSILHTNKTVNIQYHIDTTGGSGILFGNITTPISLRFSWAITNADTLFSPASALVANYNLSNWLNYTPNIIGDTFVNIQLPISNLLGKYQVGNGTTLPIITQQPSNVTICGAMGAAFKVVSSPASMYQWQVYDNNVWTNISNSTMYLGANSDVLNISQPTLSMNGLAYRCVVYYQQDSTISTHAVLNVLSSVVPSISITSSHGSSACAGQYVTFNAQPVNGGDAVQYQWMKNGQLVGASAIYTTNTLSNNDTIYCVMTSSITCAVPNSVVSNKILMNISQPQVLSVGIVPSYTNDTICANTSVTFTAQVQNAGSTPTIRWYRNNAYVSSAPTYTYTMNNGNITISCSVAGSDCAEALSANSDTLRYTVISNRVPTIAIATTNTTVCHGSTVTFNASANNSGVSPNYQWLVNGSPSGINASTFSTNTLSNGDTVSCILMSSFQCITDDSVYSNKVIMNITPTLTPSVTIAASANNVCANTNISFTATTVNVGSNVHYQWKVNNVNVGTNSSTYTSSTLSNNDVVTCIVNPGTGCFTTSSVVSNSIVMSIIPRVTPTITISVDNGQVCMGDTVMLIANISNGGANPSFQWKANNVNVGSNNDTFIAVVNGNTTFSCVLTSTEACVQNTTATSSSILVTTFNYILPTISINAQLSDTLCWGDQRIFMHNLAGGGNNPSVTWFVNGQVALIGNTPYTTDTLRHNDTISAILVSDYMCLLADTVYSNDKILTVLALDTPTVSISIIGSDTICPNTPVTFIADTTFAGANPTYIWYKNSNIVSTNARSYTDNSVTSTDIYVVELQSDITCPLERNVWSEQKSIIVQPLINASVSITANPGVDIAPGTLVTFNANVSHNSGLISYQWILNNNNVGTNSPIYSNSNLLNGDEVKLQVSNTTACWISPQVISNILRINIENVGLDPVLQFIKEISVYPNPTTEALVISGKIIGASNTPVNLSLRSITGNEILNANAKLYNNAFNHTMHLPSYIAPGVYILHFRYEKEYYQVKVIVNR